MKTLKIALSLLCFGSAALCASAQDAAVTDSDLPGAYLQGLSGRYLGAGAGNSATYGFGTGATALQPGSDWHPMESFRVELEYAYKEREPALLTSPAAEAAGAPRGGIANARVNMRVNDWLTPYVGLGVGWARSEAERLAMGYPDLRGADSFAYQGIVGLTVPFSEGLSFFADGRYLRGGEAAFTATDDFATHGTAQTWSALAGVRFTFGK